MMRCFAGAVLVALAMGAGPVLAQSPPPALNAGTDQSGSASTMSAADKQAISKSCTDQANAKGLHGKARKKFRSACKRAGGKVE